MQAKITERFVGSLKPSAKVFTVRDSELKGFCLRVRPNGGMSWFFDFRNEAGRRLNYKLGSYPGLKAEGARRQAGIIAGKIADRIDPQAEKKAERVKLDRDRLSTLSEFLDEKYEPWMLAEHKSGKAQLERIRSDFKDQLDKPMTVFNEVMVMGLRQKWKKDGKQPSTINRDLQRIGSVLTQAVKAGVLDRHPLKGLKPMKTDKGGRVRFLSAVEEKALRDALVAREDRLRAERIRFNTWRIERHLDPLPERDGENLDHLRPLVLLALNSGMRRGELFSLKWSDVDFAAEILTVGAASAKSGQTRRIPLNPEATAVLKAWHSKQSKPTGGALVFPGEGGRRLTNVNKAWRGLVKLAKLSGFNFHDLRHTFASKLVQAGVDLYSVKELLGHSGIKMTERYSHLAPGNLRAAVAKLG